ncbi:MAG: alpha-1,2-fucosyltransferase, partial [Acidimicrobiales bacterium]
RLRARARELVGAAPRYLEAADHLRYDETFERLEAPCYLHGYFQHPGYFEHSLDEVCSLVIGHLDIGERPRSADRVPVVGVHFRRGDFVALGWALGLGYYDRALELVAARVPRFEVRVFSDDRVFATLVEEHLAGRGLTVAPSPRREVDDDPAVAVLVEMAGCDHLVMANSTYSWWAASIGDRLGGPVDRVVVCPTVWDPRREPHELTRPGWLTVDTVGCF